MLQIDDQVIHKYRPNVFGKGQITYIHDSNTENVPIYYEVKWAALGIYKRHIYDDLIEAPMEPNDLMKKIVNKT